MSSRHDAEIRRVKRGEPFGAPSRIQKTYSSRQSVVRARTATTSNRALNLGRHRASIMRSLRRVANAARSVAARPQNASVATSQCGFDFPATPLGRTMPVGSVSASRSMSSSSTKHETWRSEGGDTDNLPLVERRDGTMAEIDKNRGFVDYNRIPDPYRDPLERVFDWQEIQTTTGHDPVERTVQAARCMDCGTPFCQTHTGCPVNNLIPEWNDLVYKGQWRDAIDRLHKVLNHAKDNRFLVHMIDELSRFLFFAERSHYYEQSVRGASVNPLASSLPPLVPQFRRTTFQSSLAACAQHRARARA